MRVLSVHAGADTGGIGWALAGAFRQHSSIELRSAVRSTNYIAYDQDMPWDDAALYGSHADVLHLHNTFRTAQIFGLSGKPKVIHHHGTHYRENSPRLDRETRAAQAVPVCATLDLLDFADELTELTWVPHAYDLTSIPQRTHPASRGPLRVGHAPTNRAIKSTDAFLDACSKVPGLEPVLIEGATWADCLKAKATCDVYFDQVQLGYGCNAIEAWGMGLPVIAGAQGSTLVRMQDTFGNLPFWVADESTIGDSLAEFVRRPELVHGFAAIGRRHVQRWHDGRETVARLTPIYERLTNG